MIRLVAELGRNLTVGCKHLRRRMNFLPVAGIVSCNLGCLGPAKTATRNRFLDLLAAWAGGFKILGGVALHVGSTALPSLDLVAEIAEPERQLRLVDGGCKLLAVEVALWLNRASRAVTSLSHIEDHGVGMELGRGVAVNRAGCVMLELGNDELASGFGWIVTTDASLRVAFQLRESDGHGLPMCFANTVITTYKSGERDRFGS